MDAYSNLESALRDIVDSMPRKFGNFITVQNVRFTYGETAVEFDCDGMTINVNSISAYCKQENGKLNILLNSGAELVCEADIEDFVNKIHASANLQFVLTEEQAKKMAEEKANRPKGKMSELLNQQRNK